MINDIWEFWDEDSWDDVWGSSVADPCVTIALSLVHDGVTVAITTVNDGATVAITIVC